MDEKFREGNTRIPSGCAISGIFSKSGQSINGSIIVDSITTMHDRSNGLGGGFAGYGIYPQYKELTCFHVFYDSIKAKEECEAYLERRFDIINLSKIATRKVKTITDEPLNWRYFVSPIAYKMSERHMDEESYIVHFVNKVNAQIDGAYVYSSGKNMGVFKGVGYPEDIGEYYRLEEYDGYCWTAHGRYPTNTPGWWGGAHPFALGEYSIVHNGEISSYDANRRFIEMFGYKCTLLTDTEVITYMFDYLLRKQGATLEEACKILAASFWSTIDHKPEEQREQEKYLRAAFGPMLITGPFSIMLGFNGGMLALNDRLKLRSMVCAEKGDMAYVASEECAIRIMEPNLDRIWAPKGGEPVIFKLNEEGREKCL